MVSFTEGLTIAGSFMELYGALTPFVGLKFSMTSSFSCKPVTPLCSSPFLQGCIHPSEALQLRPSPPSPQLIYVCIDV